MMHFLNPYISDHYFCAFILWFNLKCPQQVHVLKSRSPAGGVILGGSGNFRRLAKLGEVDHQE
jgi:hypothetical protein